MTTKQTTVTNGEFYDHQLCSWCIQCGATAVPIRKFDTNGEPVKPPAAEKELEVSNSWHTEPQIPQQNFTAMVGKPLTK